MEREEGIGRIKHKEHYSLTLLYEAQDAQNHGVLEVHVGLGHEMPCVALGKIREAGVETVKQEPFQ